ncbi:MAG: MFS transporter [Actinomycetota bacterium]|jgi:MFS family permease|nr:MFS transporter [Actinomycetota bacterium]
MTSAVRAAAGRTFSSLRVRNYRYYFAGQSLSLVGTWMQGIAQSWLVFTATHSGAAVGLLVAAQTLPILLLGPVGGTIADRFGKYKILLWTQSLAGVQAAVLAALDLSGHLQLWELFVMAGSLGMINAVDNPTRQTFIGEMVGRAQLSNAVTLNSVMVNVARAIGPAAAGLLIAGVGSGWCFAINAASFGFVVLALKAIRRDELAPAPRLARAPGQLREGFRYVARTPILRNSLIMMAVVGCLTYEFQTSLPLMAGVTFAGSAVTYGFFTAFMGVGAVVGGLVAASRRSRGPMRLVNTSIVFGAVVLLAALAPTPLTEELALLLVGAGSVTFLSLANATLQLESEPAMRGRVMSLWSVAFMGTTPIGGPLVGLVGGTLGARYGLGIGAMAALAAGAFGLATFGRDRRAALRAGVASPSGDPHVGAPVRQLATAPEPAGGNGELIAVGADQDLIATRPEEDGVDDTRAWSPNTTGPCACSRRRAAETSATPPQHPAARSR